MTEYRIAWQRCPHIHHPKRVSFVEAASLEDAKAVLRDHIERSEGLDTWFTVHEAAPSQPAPAGKVLR